MTWRQVSRRLPCEICGKPDWCTRSDDGAVHCMRCTDRPPGWCRVKVLEDGSVILNPANGMRIEQPPCDTTKMQTPAISSRTYSTLDGAIAAAAHAVDGKHVGTWTYTYDDGQEALNVARFNLPRGRKTFRPFHFNGDGYLMKDPPGLLPLYRLQDLKGHSRIYVVEGEKCAEAARAIGLAATTSAHGSKGAAKTDWRSLAQKEVVILQDNDESGLHYATDVASTLARFGAEVRVVLLPNLPQEGDIVDYIDAQRDADKGDDVIMQEISCLSETMPSTHVMPAITHSQLMTWQPFQTHLLPSPFAEYVEMGAKAIGCDESYIALPLLAAAASAIGNSRCIQLKRS